MSGHTPGPWSRVKPLGTRWWTLGRIHNYRAEPLPEENFDADWALAEAAPEMLAALVRAELKLSAYIGVCKDDTDLTDTVLPTVHAAIDKAEGR